MKQDTNMKSNQNIKQIKVYSWGFGKYGQIGSLDYHYSISPIELNLEKLDDSEVGNNENTIQTQNNFSINPQRVVCGEFHTAIIDDKNQLFTFGKNTFGQLGTGDTFISCCLRKVIFKEAIKIILVACGGEHTLALSSRNELFSWGLNIYGQLGLNSQTNENRLVPTKVTLFREFEYTEDTKEIIKENLFNMLEKEKIEEIAAGSHHSMILTSANKIYSCGYNKFGALGIFSKPGRLMDCKIFTFALYFPDQKMRNIVCGVQHSGCILGTSDFVIWGVGDYLNYEFPLIFSGKKYKWRIVNELQIGMNFFVITADEGDVYTVGTNNYGELANHSQIGKNTLAKVNVPEPICRIAVGYSNVIALSVNKKVYGWGSNKNGQLADQFLERILNPKEITTLSELSPIQISAGGYHCSMLSITKNFRNIHPIKTISQNRSLNLNFINSHYNYIQSLIDNQEQRKKEIQEQDSEIERLTKSIEKLKVANLKPRRSERDKESNQSQSNNTQEIFEEDIKLTELVYPNGEVSLGSGTFGEVKKCLWRKTLVAVKFLKKSNDPKLQAENVKSFIEELNILKKLRHPNILLYLGACISGPEYFLVTEYCENGNLFSYLHEQNHEKPIKDSTKIRIALEIAKGVNYLHSFDPPILHRDLKSLNILLDKNFQVKIADFGWARLRQDHMTKRRGTFQWMAPEVIKYDKYSEKADVFSFSIICWELFALEPPYSGIDKVEVAKNVANDSTFRPPLTEAIPNKIAKLLPRCWQADPKERPGFDEIIDYLEKFKLSLNN